MPEIQSLEQISLPKPSAYKAQFSGQLKEIVYPELEKAFDLVARHEYAFTLGELEAKFRPFLGSTLIRTQRIKYEQAHPKLPFESKTLKLSHTYRVLLYRRFNEAKQIRRPIVAESAIHALQRGGIRAHISTKTALDFFRLLNSELQTNEKPVVIYERIRDIPPTGMLPQRTLTNMRRTGRRAGTGSYKVDRGGFTHFRPKTRRR